MSKVKIMTKEAFNKRITTVRKIAVKLDASLPHEGYLSECFSGSILGVHENAFEVNEEKFKGIKSRVLSDTNKI